MRRLLPLFLLLSCTKPDAMSGPEIPVWCGDAEVQQDEACDDGNNVGGDGCTPECAVEDGEGEVEPNDTPDAAGPWPSGVLHGALMEGDVDCVSMEIDSCLAIGAALQPVDGRCPSGVVLELFDRDGVLVASGSAGEDGCPILDPNSQPGARYLQGGRVSVCARAALGENVPAYALTASVSDAVFEDVVANLDGDELPDRCDDDRDGDGLDNAVDDCPDVQNGPDAPPRTPNADGFFGTWLAVGPLTGRASPTGCRPSEEHITGPDDGLTEPMIGDSAGRQVWRAVLFGQDRFNLQSVGLPDPPREVYATTWVTVSQARSLTLALGLDDGARVWWNGEEVLVVDGCQGTERDEFTVAVDAVAGANRLMVKVHDQGGGWGMFARLLDGGEPVTDVTLGLSPDPAWVPGQSDLDGDGVGDLCDSTPAP